MRLKRMLPMCCQPDNVNCGPYCIKMVTEYYGKSVSEQLFKRIKKSAKKDKGATSQQRMMDTIRKVSKLKYKVLEGDTEDKMRQIKEAIKNQHPVILYCWADETPHVIIAKGIGRKYLEVNDPYEEMYERYGKKPSRIELKYFIDKNKKKYGQRRRWTSRQWGIEVYKP